MGFFFFFGFLNYFLFNYLFFLNASKMCQITDIVLLVYEKKKKEMKIMQNEEMLVC